MNGFRQIFRCAMLFVFFSPQIIAVDCPQKLYGYTRNEPDFAYLTNIHIAAVYPDIPPIEATSDTNGYFELCVPARNDGKLIVSGSSANEYLGQSLQFNMSANNSYGVMFSLLRATNQIVGTVQSSGGQPFPNVLVYANLNASARSFQIQTHADAEGRFTMKVGKGDWVIFTDCAEIDQTKFFCSHSIVVSIKGTNATQDVIIWPTTPANPPTLTSPQLKLVDGQTRFSFTITAEPGYYELFESSSLSQADWQMTLRFGIPQPYPDEFTREVTGISRFYHLKVIPPP